MRRALALAERGRGWTNPNPMVGCVIVSKGEIVGEGWHRRFGEPHAEAVALRRAGRRARGATAYVALEPCCGHPGKKTPPCAPALIAAGVRRVVAAAKDPNPAVSGRGLKQLQAAGIKVRSGLLRAEAEALNAGFFTRMRRGRPYVVMKTALSLDGRPFTPSGKSRWITGPSARRAGHELRARADAILVGIGTVLADNPALTSHGAGRDPLRVVLDARLRTPRSARCLLPPAKTLVFTASRGSLPGAETVKVAAPGGKLDLGAVLRELARRGVSTLLVEGGPTVHASFLAAGLVDEARVFLAPKLISGAGDPNRAPRIVAPAVARVGPDFLVSGKVSCSRE